MARAARILTPREQGALGNAILEATPRGKARAVTTSVLLSRIRGHMARHHIPVSTAAKRLEQLKKAKKVRVSTRVGIWVPIPGEPESSSRNRPPPLGPGMHPRGSLEFPQRRVRKVISFVCTRCFRPFPSKTEAKAHYTAVHAKKA